jgi:2-dehydro-3-deoxy-D-gluconate 5-dehydrogenase
LNKAIDLSEKDWDDVMAINSKIIFFFCQAVVHDMMKRKYEKIINVASLLAFQSGILVPLYAASKGALANEWAQHGITINAIAPSYMATNNTKAFREDPIRPKTILE